MDPAPTDQSQLPAAAAASPPSSPPPLRSRICRNCARPNAVCLCHVLPSTPIHTTTTKILILHHPHEARHKLSTVPVLSKSLLSTTTLVGRRLRPNLHTLLDQSLPTIYLFPPSPSSPAVPLSQLRSSPILASKHSQILLIVFDGTWKHAKEMVAASEGFLSKFATRVCLDEYDESVTGGSIYDSELVLRKEPFGGCVSTMEAVARCLRVVEPDGAEIERKLIQVLREMVRLQALFLRPMKPRPKLLKKSREKSPELLG